VGEMKSSFLPSDLSGCTWSRLLEACIVVLLVSKSEEVASGQPQRAGPLAGIGSHLNY
jgi:hypothetical protein